MKVQHNDLIYNTTNTNKKMATDKYSNIGKDGIIKEGIFVRFPDFEPVSKDNYWNSNKHRKLLIVAESSYFEDEAESVYKSVFKANFCLIFCR